MTTIESFFVLAALLMPVVDFLDRRGAPRGGAVALVLLSGIAGFGGLLAFVVTQFVEPLFRAPMIRL